MNFFSCISLWWLFLDNFKHFLDENSQVDHCFVSWTLWLEILEKDLSSEVPNGLVNDIFFFLIGHLWCRTWEICFERKESSSTECLNIFIITEFAVICNQSCFSGVALKEKSELLIMFFIYLQVSAFFILQKFNYN